MNLTDYKLKPFISAEKIAQRVEQIGQEINKDFEGEEVTAVFLLNGAMFFGIDLIRHISLPVIVDTLSVSSYEGMSSSGVIKINSDLKSNLKDKNILLIEDIIDTGQTLESILKFVSQKKPKKIVTACLLNKPSRRLCDVEVEYIGFEIEDKFVVGYGLDYEHYFRNLKEIKIYEPQ